MAQGHEILITPSTPERPVEDIGVAPESEVTSTPGIKSVHSAYELSPEGSDDVLMSGEMAESEPGPARRLSFGGMSVAGPFSGSFLRETYESQLSPALGMTPPRFSSEEEAEMDREMDGVIADFYPGSGIK
jgi:hypothetical protein